MELCIDFGGTEIKLAVTRGDLVLATDSVLVRGDAGDLATAATASHEFLARTDAARPEAVGIAVPGVVHPITRRMLHANAKYDYLRDTDLLAWASDEFQAPAVIENDARAALVGEISATGSAPGERDAVLVTLGTGIGTAALMNGTLVRGWTGHAGILGGHVTTDIHAGQCPCGNIGCAELLASSWALRQHSNSADSRSDYAPTVKDLFTTDDHADLRDSFLHVWGATVVTLIHMYDPAVVILSGGILRAGDAVRAPIENYVRQHLWASLEPPRFVVPPEPQFSVARGLSVLARTLTNTSPRSDEETS
ncbi:ROK family protein [Microbacterium sp.]|uniref:ROK family protein n=1 Tax=Microbacterium sp. TaxID=51671 RepID=UPI0028111581|nr:ROK family protein [Microbacterium sp.]